MRCVFMWPFVLTSLAFAVPCAAQPRPDEPRPTVQETPWSQDPDRWSKAQSAVEVQFGLGAPYGLLGLAFDQGIGKNLALNVGVGVTRGVNAGAMARLRLPSGDSAWGLESGISAGRYVVQGARWTSRSGEEYEYTPAFWWQSGLTYETRETRNTRVRYFLGWAHLLNESDWECSAGGECGSGPSSDATTFGILYLGVAIGHGFGW